MADRWAARSEAELAGWSHEERESRVVFSRLEQWKAFHEKAPYCILCRVQNLHAAPGKADIRFTSVGSLCLSCWLDWPACESCGTGAVAVGDRTDRKIAFRGKQICGDCLVPEIPAAWSDWLMWFYTVPRSSYQRVFEACPLARA